MSKSDINKNNNKKHIKSDVLLIAAILIAAGLLYLVFTFVVKKQGEYVQVKVDGNVICELDLSVDTVKTISGYNGGSNEIVIKDKAVYIKDADCPDKLCVNMGKISKTGETIVCLPHRVVVQITGSEKNSSSIDSLVR